MSVLTPLDIVNRAAARIGVEPLQSLDDETIGGRSAELVYTSVIEYMLGIYPFSFSRDLRRLSRLEAAPIMGAYEVAHLLPPDRLGPPQRVIDDPTDPDRGFSEFLLVGEKVFSLVEDLYAEITIVPPVPLWSGAFREAAILLLAAELALAIAHDKALRAELRENALGTPAAQPRGGAMGAAISNDSRATAPRKLQAFHPLLSAHMS